MIEALDSERFICDGLDLSMGYGYKFYWVIGMEIEYMICFFIFVRVS